MNVTFFNPGIDYMLRRIMAFQTDEESSFWSEPLYHFYPQLDKAYAQSLSFESRKDYIEYTLRQVYAEVEKTIDNKILQYTQYWEKHNSQITDALSDAFCMDCAAILNDLHCNVTMNPVQPRFLKQHCFDLFYLNSERGALGTSIHEIIHFVWFHVWNQTFSDRYDEYERPSMKWILSEMVVESIMRDSRLSSINPYFPREHGGCIYPYFFDMKVNNKLILETIDNMYKNLSMTEFMKASYAYCVEHEVDIRTHIQASES